MTSPRYVIVNGDDFGFSHGVNEGIIQAHTEGILTSTSLMVAGEAVDEAVDLAKQHPSLGVGLHVVLGCGKAVLPPEQIPHLVDEQGQFPDNPAQAGWRYYFNQAARRELHQEIEAQLQCFLATGLSLSHVDGHLHHHANPAVLNVLMALAPKYNIPIIRLPYEELTYTLKADSQGWLAKGLGWSVFRLLRRHGERVLSVQGIRYAERVYGLLQSGAVTESYLMRLIPQIQANVVELYAHPAIAYPHEPINGPEGAGERELAALLSPPVKAQLQASGFQLTNYPELIASAAF
ncbi:hopanoid biosynthesis-associated protein HpnK [Acaryochloris marina]|uniref:YdjC-like protein n=1 Tax=Acaryochloris marina (strain MBIC 11017) TaxID=329726 RepID=B0BZJ6_ACAM1|nr:hopanoid biosynthesis-associated protein HpnK [Acaryochloris marina]ABW30741.1 YdjC-like protein [Acaryochloris marina MBIC11017]BDM79517.1 hydrolase [Acaryochloris marina MBIC10699]